jgi:hypothetical protein
VILFGLSALLLQLSIPGYIFSCVFGASKVNWKASLNLLLAKFNTLKLDSDCEHEFKVQSSFFCSPTLVVVSHKGGALA